MVLKIFKRIILVVFIVASIILLLFGLHTCNAVKFNDLTLSELNGCTFVNKEMTTIMVFLQDDIVEISHKKSETEQDSSVYTAKQDENVIFLTSDIKPTITLLTISYDELFHSEANTIYYRAVVVL